MLSAFLWWVQHDAATYLSRALKIAYEIGLRPHEFWAMTPAELTGMVNGFRRRDELEWERAAWMVRHLYAMNGAKRVPTVDKLLGRKSPKA